MISGKRGNFDGRLWQTYPFLTPTGEHWLMDLPSSVIHTHTHTNAKVKLIVISIIGKNRVKV